MTESSEAFFINKCSSMSFKELGEYIAMCFEYLENPQKHLANAKKAPVLKETYDVLIERLESKLTRIDNLVYCKNEFESLCALNIEIASFNSLESYYRITEEDKRNIETEVQLKRQKLKESILLLLRNLLFESKTALIFLNSSESFCKILDLLHQLSESNREIEKVIIDFRIEDFQNIFFEKFQPRAVAICIYGVNSRYLKDETNF